MKQRFFIPLLITILAGCTDRSDPYVNKTLADKVFHNDRVYTVNSGNDIVEAVLR